MKKNIKPVLLLFFLLFPLMTFPAFSQKELNGLIQDFNRFHQNNFQEKVYTHTDRSFYLAGELVWFKLYCMNASEGGLSEVSKVAYVEIVDSNNHALVRAKVALENGMGNGSFLLPATLTSGSYIFRSYTNWMKNYSQDLFFEKPLTIINSLTSASGKKNKNKGNNYDIQFFPEGGNLVMNLESKVAFKGVDHLGRGIDFSGVVINQDGDTVEKFKPFKFGIGNFRFTPKAGEQYQFLIKTPNDSLLIKDLPDIAQQGTMMSLSKSGPNQILLNFKTTTNALKFYLVGCSNKRIDVAEVIEVKNGGGSVIIKEDKLSEGISQFILFNEEKKPVCERLYFKLPSKHLEINVETDRLLYSSKQKVDVNISTNEDNTPVSADLSVAVYRIDSLPALAEMDIETYAYLLSDLKGNIEFPEFYLDHRSTEADSARDNLMLTHGWRRFKWDDVQSDTLKPQYVPEFRGHFISGKVLQDAHPVPNVFTYLSVPGKKFYFNVARTDDEGIVRFETKDFYGTKNLLFQTNTQLDSGYRLQILSPFDLRPSTYKIPPFLLSDQFKNSLKNRSLSMQLMHSYFEDSINKVSLSPVDSGNFFGTADRTYFLDDYTRFVTLEEVMREYVPEVAVRRRKDQFHFKVMDVPRRTVFQDDPLVLLDGVPIFDMHKMMDFSPLKIKQMDILTSLFILGPSTFKGIVNYSTYKGNLEGFELDPKALMVEYEGMQLKREFYAPKYEFEEQKQSRLPDFRTLLYWSPDLTTGKDGKQHFSFYTSDLTGKFLIDLQGLSHGAAGSKTIVLEVKKTL